MNGWSYDYMLALDDVNCKKRQTARNAKSADLKKYAAEIANNSKLSAFFDKNGGAEKVCEYVNWAYTESIALDASFETNAGVNLDNAWTTCRNIGKNFTMEYNNIENQLKGISTNDLRFNLQKRVVQWLGNNVPDPNVYSPTYNIPSQFAEIN